MNTESSQIPCRSLFPGLGLLLTLASCGAGHVGEAWQCPLTQGSQCISVERADPAVRPLAQPTALAPLALDSARVSGAETTGTASAAAAVQGPDARDGAASEKHEFCSSSCNPVGRLWRWLTGGDSRISAGAGDVATEAAPPEETSSAHVTGIPTVADARILEKIGRVWIAPWVDAAGVYREGAWVRIVLSPATWRRPH